MPWSRAVPVFAIEHSGVQSFATLLLSELRDSRRGLEGVGRSGDALAYAQFFVDLSILQECRFRDPRALHARPGAIDVRSLRSDRLCDFLAFRRDSSPRVRDEQSEGHLRSGLVRTALSFGGIRE